MKAVEVVNNSPVFTAEASHLIFYKLNGRSAFCAVNAVSVGNPAVFTEPDEIKCLKARGAIIESAHQIEKGDAEALLRGYFA